MNVRTNIKIGRSVCPHDCPSACALDVELLDAHTIGRVRGAKDNSYTLGVICEKVGRYAERIHHPDRLLHPLKRKGAKGDGQWQRLSWDDAMGEVADAFLKTEARHGALSVWPYYYAGTMGLVMRDGINRLRHAKNYSGLYDTFCVALSWSGYVAGCGRMTGSDPREMQKSDLIVIWGTNPVNTQVNVMTHAALARKQRGARIACVDVTPRTATLPTAPNTVGAASTIRQTVRLDANSPRLEFHCDVDWQESRKFLKVAFPVTVRAMNATYEMQFGCVERPTHFNTSYDLARFEVPGHKWVDLSEHGFGVVGIDYQHIAAGHRSSLAACRSGL